MIWPPEAEVEALAWVEADVGSVNKDGAVFLSSCWTTRLASSAMAASSDCGPDMIASSVFVASFTVRPKCRYDF